MEAEGFQNDKKGRIFRSTKFVFPSSGHIMETIYYRYAGGLLVAKETDRSDSDSEERQGINRYFYDPTGRMIEFKRLTP